MNRQVETGIDIVDDGEFSKTSWITYFYQRVGGIEQRSVPLSDANALPPDLDREAFAEYYDGHDIAQASDVSAGHSGEGEHAMGTASTGRGKHWVCTGPLTYDAADIERDIDNLRRAAARAGAGQTFLPVLAPASAYWLDNEYYGSDEEFVFALAEALRAEYRKIVDAGILLQVDDAVLWHMYGTMRLKGQSTAEYRRWAVPRIEALNHALDGIPPERVRYHVCCGSWHGAHTFDPELADVLDLVLAVNARAYLIEQGNARHEHEWEMWKTIELPDDKVLIPGVITHHTEMVEHLQAADRGAPGQARRGRRARAGDRWRGLWLCPRRAHAARSPLDPMGEAGRARRGRSYRERAALAHIGRVALARPARRNARRSGQRRGASGRSAETLTAGPPTACGGPPVWGARRPADRASLTMAWPSRPRTLIPGTACPHSPSDLVVPGDRVEARALHTATSGRRTAAREPATAAAVPSAAAPVPQGAAGSQGKGVPAAPGARGRSRGAGHLACRFGIARIASALARMCSLGRCRR